jgi:hypothetical protein
LKPQPTTRLISRLERIGHATAATSRVLKK